jgi:hypothetical protein
MMLLFAVMVVCVVGVYMGKMLRKLIVVRNV